MAIGIDIDFVNQLGAVVVVDNHEQNIDTLENNAIDFVFDNLYSRAR